MLSAAGICIAVQLTVYCDVLHYQEIVHSSQNVSCFLHQRIGNLSNINNMNSFPYRGCTQLHSCQTRLVFSTSGEYTADSTFADMCPSNIPPICIVICLPPIAVYCSQGVTKRCRLSWLTNSALIYEPKCGGRGELRGLCHWVQLHTGAQIYFGDLAPYSNYGRNHISGVGK